MRLPPLVIGLATAIASIAGSASATPTSFTLSFQGSHVTDPSFPAGLRHEGRFTASAPFCPAGKAVDTRDVELEPLTVLRTHTCDDGTGSFTALMPAVAGEHGGGGSWKIVEGTGRYATLRGIGTYAGHIISGDPQVFETIVFETSWQGVVDFDIADPRSIWPRRRKSFENRLARTRCERSSTPVKGPFRTAWTSGPVRGSSHRSPAALRRGGSTSSFASGRRGASGSWPSSPRSPTLLGTRA
jgi:hypothetical protein